MNSTLMEKAISVLRSGGIIAHATETCYGFACDAINRSALARLFALKKMSVKKPVSILVWNFQEAQRYGVFITAAKKLAEKYWPGPLTIVVKRKKSLPDFLNPGYKTIGIRVPGHALSRKLVKKFGRPMTTTSANISGLPSPYSVSAIRRQFVKSTLKPDFIIDSGKIKKNPPSTIVNAEKSPFKILRQGSLSTKITQ